MDTLCDIMTDESRGSNIQRYADVNSLILDTYSQPCLNLRYNKLAQSLNHTSWNSVSAKGSKYCCVLANRNYPSESAHLQIIEGFLFKLLIHLREGQSGKFNMKYKSQKTNVTSLKHKKLKTSLNKTRCHK